MPVPRAVHLTIINPRRRRIYGPEGRMGLAAEKDTGPEGRIENCETKTCLGISEKYVGINITNHSLQTSRSPVKDLITSFEKLQQTENVIPSMCNKKNHKTSTSSEHFQLGKVKKLAETFSNTSEDIPETPAIRNSQVDGRQPIEEIVFPEADRERPAASRKVWTRLKSGLFGWRKPQKPRSGWQKHHPISQNYRKYPLINHPKTLD